MTREKAEMGVLISLKPPTRDMRKEAASAGFYKSPFDKVDYPKLQILTVEELLTGKKINAPAIRGGDLTFKAAPKAKKKASHRQKSFDDE